MQYGEDGVGRRKSGPIASRATSGRLAQRGTGKRLKAEVWVETVTEGGRKFMAAWRKEKVDAARHRQKRKATRLGNLLSQTGV